jgi:hypothetical protein
MGCITLEVKGSDPIKDDEVNQETIEIICKKNCVYLLSDSAILYPSHPQRLLQFLVPAP